MPDAASKPTQWISVIVTAAALALAVLHVIFPSAKIDAVTLVLLAIAVVPWLAPILKTVELPGGWKFEFRELKEKVEQELRDNRSQVRDIAQRVEELAQFAISGAAPTTLMDQLARDLSAYRNYLIGLGIDLSGNPPTVEIPEKEYDNAHYDGAKNQIVAGKNFASSDILYREYTHHALRKVRGQTGLADDRQDAVESALADYYPCSYRNDPLLGREAAVYYRRISGFDKPSIRDLETTATTSDLKNFTPQAAGEIWAAAFWETRKLLGQDATDRLLLQAWRATPPGAKAEAAFSRKVKELAGAAHKAAVAEAFARRKLPA